MNKSFRLQPIQPNELMNQFSEVIPSDYVDLGTRLIFCKLREESPILMNGSGIMGICHISQHFILIIIRTDSDLDTLLNSDVDFMTNQFNELDLHKTSDIDIVDYTLLVEVYKVFHCGLNLIRGKLLDTTFKNLEEVPSIGSLTEPVSLLGEIIYINNYNKLDEFSLVLYLLFFLNPVKGDNIEVIDLLHSKLLTYKKGLI